MNRPDQDNGSLHRRLLIGLWTPLLMVLTLGAIVAFILARHFGNVVHDRWLYDSAMTLAAQLELKSGRIVLDLPKPAVEMFKWDRVDHIYEEVASAKQGRIFGEVDLPSPPEYMSVGKPEFYNSVINGSPVRIVALSLPNLGDHTDTVIIQVAETKNKRQALITEIIMLSVPLQAGILVLAGAFIVFAVTSSLRVLDEVAERLAGYEPDALVPVSDFDNAPSEVKPLLKAINHLINKLSAAQDTQRRFVANAAHQLRTPLATLQVQAERALREPDPAKHGEALSHVLTAVTRMRRVAHQLLTLARSDRSSEQMVEMTSVDLAALAREELERWADAAIARNIDLGYDGPESNINVTGQPYLLHELIGNLVDNAIRYGKAGGVVTLGLRESPTMLFVEDDGPGIPLEERTLVLERFYRRSNSTGDGCGLGLAIASEIVARHGARLSIVDRGQSAGIRIEIMFPDVSIENAPVSSAAATSLETP
ncbi:MAG TPA: sensor histidine kinase N-terminal domain-containing protein [Burkholderiales bacterium]|nr:sensor histidine kinase N-terminal domain-containing protein [Burkholderiales bacterium]